MPYPVYATKEDLINYLGLETDNSLPKDIDRIIKRASEFIHYITFGNVRPENENHMQAVKLATCAQVEYLLKIGEDVIISNTVPNSYSIGDVSMSYFIDSDVNSKQASVRAKHYLNQEGLMYRGLGW